jgi:predicted nucleotidyltransferase
MDPQRVAEVARRHGIRMLLQFGSSVTGTLHRGSDLDLAVQVEQVHESFGPYADLIADLQALVPDREVDVILLNHADPLLLKRITDHCTLLYGSRRQLDALELYAFKQYQDHRRFLQMEQAYLDRMITSTGR